MAQVTQADLARFSQELARGDRAGFYLDYYNVTGSTQILSLAQISSFSGIPGAAAELANQIDAAIVSKYPSGGVESFSLQIANNIFAAVQADVNNNGTGVLNNSTILNTAQQTWNDLDIGQYFPGNALAVQALLTGNWSYFSTHSADALTIGAAVGLFSGAAASASQMSLQQERDYYQSLSAFANELGFHTTTPTLQPGQTARTSNDGTVQWIVDASGNVVYGSVHVPLNIQFPSISDTQISLPALDGAVATQLSVNQDGSGFITAGDQLLNFTAQDTLNFILGLSPTSIAANGQITDTTPTGSISALVFGQGVIASLDNASIEFATGASATVYGSGNTFSLTSNDNITLAAGQGEISFVDHFNAANSSANLTTDTINFGGQSIATTNIASGITDSYGRTYVLSGTILVVGDSNSNIVTINNFHNGDFGVDFAPQVTVPGAQTVAQGTMAHIAGVSISSADSASDIITTTLTDTNGILSVSGNVTGGGGTITGSGTHQLTITGTQAQINADLATLGYVDFSSGSDTINVTTNDGHGGSDSKQIAIKSLDNNGDGVTEAKVSVNVYFADGDTLTGSTIVYGTPTSWGWSNNPFADSNLVIDQTQGLETYYYISSYGQASLPADTQTVFSLNDVLLDLRYLEFSTRAANPFRGPMDQIYFTFADPITNILRPGNYTVTNGSDAYAYEGLPSGASGNISIAAMDGAGFSNIFNPAGFTYTGQDNTITGLSGSNTNDGTIALNSIGNATALQISGDTTLSGSGTVQMSNTAQNSIVGATGNDSLTIGSGQTVQGSGSIGGNGLSLTNQGTILANQSTALNITSAITNNGLIAASGATLDVQGAVTGTGRFSIGDPSTIEFDNSVSSGQTVSMDGTEATLILADPVEFAANIDGFVPGMGDTINLKGITLNGKRFTIANGNVLTLQESNGALINLKLDPTQDYSADYFAAASDGNGGTSIIVNSGPILPVIINNADGTSIEEIFTGLPAGASEEDLYYSSTDATGTLTSDVVNYTAGNSRIERFNISSSISEEDFDYSGLNGTGTLNSEVIDNTDGTSIKKVFTGLPAGVAEADFYYTGLDGTGILNSEMINNANGTSIEEIFTGLPAGISEEDLYYSAADATGNLTSEIVNYTAGNSRVEKFNVSASISEEIFDYSGLNGTGTLNSEVINNTDGTSIKKVFAGLPTGATEADLNYTGSDATGTLTTETIYYTNGDYSVETFNPANDVASETERFTSHSVVGKALFSGADINGNHGLWLTDGTSANTVDLTLDMDISPSNITVFGSKALFSADDTNGYTQLWITDGTAAGTTQVTDVANGINPSNIVVVGGKALFDGVDANGHEQLWVSDGTLDGTAQLTSVVSGVNPSTITPLGNIAIFKGADASGHQQLWVSDGTAEGTMPLTSVPAGSYPANIAILGNKAVFTGADNNGYSQLWVTDGTEEGTVQVTTTASGINPTNIIALNNTEAVFSGMDANGNLQLWETDGTVAGTALLATAASGLDPAYITALGNKALFTGLDSNGYFQLWITDGTAHGTVQLTNGASNFNPENIIALNNNKAIFIGFNTTGYQQLWVTDGTAAGTSQLTSASTGINPLDMTAVGNKVFFIGRSATGTQQLWVSDGTTSGTIQLTTTMNVNPRLASFLTLTPFGNGVLFKAADTSGIQALWVSDGTTAGTHEVTAANAYAYGINPQDLTSYIASSNAPILTSKTINYTDGTSLGEAWTTNSDGSTTEVMTKYSGADLNGTQLYQETDTTSADGQVVAATITGSGDTLTVGSNESVSVMGNGNTLQAATGTDLTGNTLSFEGNLLSGTTVTNGTDSYGNSYALSGTTLTITSGTGEVLTLADFANGDFGITLPSSGPVTYNESNSAIAIADNVNAVVTGSSNTITIGNGDTVSVSGYNNGVTVSGSGSVVSDDSSSSLTVYNVTGNSDSITLAGYGDTATISGSGDTVTVSATAASVTESGSGNNSITLAGDSETATIAGSNDILTLSGYADAATINGAGNETVHLTGTNDSLSETGSGGNHITLSGDSETAVLGGSNSMITLSGYADAATINGAGHETVNLTGTNDSLIETGSGSNTITLGGDSETATIGGSNSTITLSGYADSVTINGAGNEVIHLTGTNDSLSETGFGGNTITLSGDSETAAIGGSNSTITLSGYADSVAINGAGNEVINLTGTNETLTEAGYGSNTITLSGDTDTATIGGSNSSITLSGYNDFATITGSNETITLSGTNASVTLSGQNDVVTAASGTTVNIAAGDAVVINGSGVTVTGGASARATINHIDGTSAVEVFNQSATILSNTKNYTGTNGSGTLVSQVIDYTDGTSRQNLFTGLASGLTEESLFYSGADMSGVLAKEMWNYAAGNSTVELFNPSSTIASNTKYYDGLNGTGNLISQTIDYTNGTSQQKLFSNLSSGVTQESLFYSGLDLTGVLTKTIIDYANGSSVIERFNPSSTVLSRTSNYDGLDGTGNLTSETYDMADGTSRQYLYTGLASGISAQKLYYSGADLSGSLTKQVTDYTNGASTVELFNSSSTILTNTKYYTGLDGTGTLTSQTIDFTDGTSRQVLYTNLPAGVSQEQINYSGADLTGTVTSTNFIGTSGDDTLTATATKQTLTGNGGSDTYQFGRGDGYDTIRNGLSTNTGPSGELLLGSNITKDQLWFEQKGNNLQVDILGTTDHMTIVNWYSNSYSQLSDIRTAGGNVIDSQLAQLVQAMATYSANHTGFNPATATAMPTDPTLQSTLAASWH